MKKFHESYRLSPKEIINPILIGKKFVPLRDTPVIERRATKEREDIFCYRISGSNAYEVTGYTNKLPEITLGNLGIDPHNPIRHAEVEYYKIE